MRIGDTVTDTKGRSWAIQAHLGRGLWGTTFLVESRSGNRAILKAPLTEEDFTSNHKELAQFCAIAANEQSRLLSGAGHKHLPQLVDTVPLSQDRVALLLPHLGESLAQRLSSNAPVSEIFHALSKVADALTEARPVLHGNLSPNNIFLPPGDQVYLTDVITLGLHNTIDRLKAECPDRIELAPPEGDSVPTTEWDPWALCFIMYVGTLESESTRRDTLQKGAVHIDKLELAATRDRLLGRLKAEDGNPRFMSRVADHVGKVLSRGLSKEVVPSPPYRFASVSELFPRFRAIASLVHPRVENVGQVLLSSAARDGVFKDGAAPSFSVTVGCSGGTTHEDVATGIRVKNLDAKADSRVPIPGAQYTVKTHPSGRLRFDFSLPNLDPGRYRAKVAFTVKDSGDKPVLSEGRFEVRPPPGYVPPQSEDLSVRGTLQFPTSKAPSSGPMHPDPDMDPPSDASDASIFPEPIAPSSPGLTPTIIPKTEEAPTGPKPLAPSAPPAAIQLHPTGLESTGPASTPVSPDFDSIAPRGTSPSGSWEPLPSPDVPLAAVPPTTANPSADSTQELPVWNQQQTNSKNSIRETFDRLGGFLWQNTTVAFVAILGLLVLFLVFVGILMQSCGT